MKIQEVSKLTGFSAYTLRYYEKEGLVHVLRDENGVRQYEMSDINILHAIACYRRAGVSLSQIKALFNSTDDDFHLQILQDSKANMEAEKEKIEATLAYLDLKIRLHSGEISRGDYINESVELFGG
ncbi:MerR family transcriptional regulator [Lactococcus insecticola]|uniref:Transcriptional regulator n=1 Tax=Pseudolactococcus insecticola TaxID=2709158 RepID=A0A6A0B6V7_9LACT|nr:MerR family transcriptional regulator [Lactococcus insecticola]GFH40208.1 transcriptional regulator [Lactococcus insecticola]